MTKLCRIHFVAGCLALAAAVLDARAKAADQAPGDAKAEQLFQPAAPSDLPPTEMAGASCANGACSAGGGGHDKSHHVFHALARWICYQPVRLQVACGWQPTAYRPPVYMWFQCKPGMCGTAACGMPGGCAVPFAGQMPAGQQVAKAKHFDDPLPKPEMPKLAVKEQSLVSGSSAVMGDKKEPVAVTPVNYKAMPVMPIVPLQR